MIFLIAEIQNPPPADIPQVEIPAPDIGSAAEEFLDKLDKTGFWGSLFADLIKWIPRIIGWTFGTIVNLFAWFAAKIVGILVTIEENSTPAFSQLTRAAIKDLFGKDVNIGGVGPTTRESRETAARDIGEAVLQGLFGPVTGGTAGGGIEPSDRRAREFLTTMTQLALEGWLEGWLIEVFSAGQIEQFGELDDILAQTLGLGRLSRRVLNPPLQILVEQPFEALLNKLYRPKMLTPGQCSKALKHGDITPAECEEILARQGFSAKNIAIVLDQEEKNLSVGDLDYLVSRGMMTMDAAVKELGNDGWDAVRARTLLEIEASKRLDPFRRALANEAVDHYENRDIEASQFFSLLDATGIPDREKEMLRRVAAVRRELRVKLLSVGEMKDMIARGIQGRSDLRALLTRQGYSPADALHLELLLIDEVKDQVEAQKARDQRLQEQAAAAARKAEELKAREAEAAARAALGGLNLSQEQDLIRRGIRSIDDYQTFLVNLKFSPEAAADLVEALSTEITERAAAEKRREELRAEAAIRHVNLGQVEQGVLRGFLSVEDYRRFLIQNQFDEEAQGVLVRLLQSELDQQARQKAQREEAERMAELKKISLADLERGVRFGIISVEIFNTELIKRDFDAAQRELLVSTLQAELDRDGEARKKREEAAARAAEKDLSLAELEKAVRSGLRTVEQFRGDLADLGFSAEEQDLVVRLVELDMARDQAAAEARDVAAKRLATKNISLADLERAVELGVVSVDTYSAALVREGFSEADRNILVLALTTRLKRAAEALATREEQQKIAAAKGLDLPAIERAYRAGTISAGEFESRLLGFGFEPEPVTLLRTLIDREIAQRKAEEERRKQIAAELRKRKLSLAQFERAVKTGLRTFDDYAAFLSGEGFADEDVQLLVDLLLTDLEAAAAKAPKAT